MVLILSDAREGGRGGRTTLLFSKTWEKMRCSGLCGCLRLPGHQHFLFVLICGMVAIRVAGDFQGTSLEYLIFCDVFERATGRLR